MTDADWLNEVPTDRPAVIVADGLMGFLTKDEFVSVVNRLISHFPSGEMASNSYTPLPFGPASMSLGLSPSPAS